MADAPASPLLPEIADLHALASDLHWTWNHQSDALWQAISPDIWRRTANAWTVLQNAPLQHLKQLADDGEFRATLARAMASRRAYLAAEGRFAPARSGLAAIAYFSMEFGLGAVLPIYAGGLGVLAGDYLKTASDLGLPVIGIGLLYQEGYFRQTIDADGRQHELYPYNEPASLPLTPAQLADGSRLKIALNFPGRVVHIRVWQAVLGRVRLYLLDSNDALNDAADRGITAKLYGAGSETRLMQELVLGIAGWRVAQALQPETELCHINEGHAAFAVIERARALAGTAGLSFKEALWATRPGNIFTTHTPVPVGFDRFSAEMLRKYFACVAEEMAALGTSAEDLLSLGQAGEASEGFSMACLAMRGSGKTFGVSRLHGQTSREIFQPLFPRWPRSEVPVGHVTNGVHIPSWDGPAADALWTRTCGKERWRAAEAIAERIARVGDEDLWAMRGEGRARLVELARSSLASQLKGRGLTPGAVAQAEMVLDPNVLTLGLARRFTGYKRPNLLLHDPVRFQALLCHASRPVQVIVAGKADPADAEGKAMIAAWVGWAQDPLRRRHVVFLEDYDIRLAQEMVQGVDVWINTPRRPWEACGTSGMKVLVNGGLNCSVLDGWWAEAFSPEVGWAIGDGLDNPVLADARDASALYGLLENQIVPEFYDRDQTGLPRRWLARIRESISRLTPNFSSTRMLRDYVEEAYLPAQKILRARGRNSFAQARALCHLSGDLSRYWQEIHIGEPLFSRRGEDWEISVSVFLESIATDMVSVEAFAEGLTGNSPEIHPLRPLSAIPGTIGGNIYGAAFPAQRPAGDYTIRVVPHLSDGLGGRELPLILWQR